MKTLGKFTGKNLSLFLGALGFIVLFIIFAFPFCSIGEQDYTLYSLFFMIDDYSLFPMGGILFFIVFMINFLLYLSLLVVRLFGKDIVKTIILGVAGIIINSLNIIALFALLFSFDNIGELIPAFIALELIGLFIMYAAWISACKNRVKEENGYINTKKYIIYSMTELIFFLFPLAIFLGFLLLVLSGNFGQQNIQNGKSTTQFKINKKDNTITVNNVKYLVNDNRLFDIKTKKEVGYIENDKVIFI